LIKNVRLLMLVIALIFLVISCSGPDDYVSVKYRNTPVNIGTSDFEYLNTDKSSWIRGAWYDSSNRYMVINLDGTYYHYCGMQENIWKNFKRAESFGRYYNQHIKGQFDCRTGHVPDY